MSEKVLHRLFTFVAILALLLGMGGTGHVSAQDPSPRPLLPRDTFPRGAVDLSLVTPLIEKGGPAKVVVILEQPSLIDLALQAQQNGLQMAPESAQSALTTIRSAQETLQAQLESPGIGGTTLFKNQRVYNGIALKVDGSRLPRIAALPGVARIVPLETHTVENAYASDLIGAKDVWNSLAAESQISYTGKGVSIAVIDTGIDFLHRNFGGPGNDNDEYVDAAAATDDFTTEDPDVFPTAKVVGGWDFAGDEYDANDEALDTPAPDPIPMDCNGHGSHVAGSAAGFGVNEDGTTFNGPWVNTLDTMALRIGPGMAPQAELYALRVFGCAGSTNLTDQAIEWAVDPDGDGDPSDHVDIINMSLGSDFGTQESSSTIAAEAAVAAGVIVVASSGNAGDTSYITGSPAVATRAINVAATVDAYSQMDGFEVKAPAGIAGIYGASAAVAWPTATVPSVTGDLKYAPAGNRNGCAAFPAGYFAGKIALLDWTVPQVCGSVTRSNNATNAGAIGVLMIYDAPILEISITGSSNVPSMITTQAVGKVLKDAIAGGQTVNVTLTTALFASVELIEPQTNDMMASFSSRGPRTGDVGLKPDIAAPGMTIFSTLTGRTLEGTSIVYGTGEDGISINGTSMASPIVAGSMAILREQHPDWTAEELKALVMNTATTNVYSGPNRTGAPFSPVRAGAGRINVQNAVSSEVIAYNNDIEGAVSVSFGHVEVTDVYTEDITVTVSNKGSQDVTYDMAYQAVTDNPGVVFALRDMANTAITSITVPHGTTREFKVSLTATAADLRNVRDAAMAAQQEVSGGLVFDRIYLSDEAGLIKFTGTGLPELRLPVHIAAVPVSAMEAEVPTFRTFDNQAGTVDVTLTGTGVNSASGAYPEKITSLVSVFELVAKSDRLPTPSPLEQMADLQAVGIATDYAAATPDVAAVYFGIAAYGEWDTPSEVEYDVYFDVDEDGVFDFLLFTTPLPTSGGDATDVLVTYLMELTTESGVVQNYINFDDGTGPYTQLLNNNVMVLPVYAEDLFGVGSTDTTFNYQVVTRSAYNPDIPVDFTEAMSYDIANPVVDVSGGFRGMPTYADLPGEVIPVAYDRTGSNVGKETNGLLLLHHHNEEGTRVEILPGRTQYMPILSK